MLQNPAAFAPAAAAVGPPSLSASDADDSNGSCEGMSMADAIAAAIAAAGEMPDPPLLEGGAVDWAAIEAADAESDRSPRQ